MTAGPPLDLDEVRRTNWDAVVIGAGPAGALAGADRAGRTPHAPDRRQIVPAAQGLRRLPKPAGLGRAGTSRLGVPRPADGSCAVGRVVDRISLPAPAAALAGRRGGFPVPTGRRVGPFRRGSRSLLPARRHRPSRGPPGRPAAGRVAPGSRTKGRSDRLRRRVGRRLGAVEFERLAGIPAARGRKLACRHRGAAEPRAERLSCRLHHDGCLTQRLRRPDRRGRRRFESGGGGQSASAADRFGSC